MMEGRVRGKAVNLFVAGADRTIPITFIPPGFGSSDSTLVALG